LNRADVFELLGKGPFHNKVTSILAKNLLTGGDVVINITGDGDIFNGGIFKPGYVAKTIIDGTVHTVGEGESFFQSPDLIGQWPQDRANNYVWKDLVERIIKDCGCK
jgi:hypothetical protein